mmetsp:Transcript_887/g.2247  ORF Transcript_887/g.2247 Transcript_887/m.2247 type:complete len:534 (+) Transcript_887:477-2078(+)
MSEAERDFERQANGLPAGPSRGHSPHSTAAFLSEAQERLRTKQHQQQLARRARAAANNFNGWRGPQDLVLPIVWPNLPLRLHRSFWSLQGFEKEKKLYQGHVSAVYQARDTQSGESVCLKVYSKANLSPLSAHQVLREIRLHSQVQHTNVIQFYAAWEDAARYFIVTEFAKGGDVFTDLQRKGGELPERTAIVSVIQPLLSVLMYLHDLGIIHRDLKPDNMLYVLHGAEKHLKVADFGLAIKCDEERPVTRAGTLDYMPPEVLVCPTKHEPEDGRDVTSPAYGPPVDVWGLGIVAYELLVGATPFEAEERVDTIKGILQGDADIPGFLSEGARDFIRVTLAKNPHQRPTVKQLMGHPWVQELAEPRSAIYSEGEMRRILSYRGGDLAAQFKEGLSWKGDGQRMAGLLQGPSAYMRSTESNLSSRAQTSQPAQPLDMHPSLESSLLSRGSAQLPGHMSPLGNPGGDKAASSSMQQDIDSANGCLGMQQPRGMYMWPQSEPQAALGESDQDAGTPMDLDEHPSLESLLMRQRSEG